MMLMEASCPSKSDAAVTTRTRRPLTRGSISLAGALIRSPRDVALLDLRQLIGILRIDGDLDRAVVAPHFAPDENGAIVQDQDVGGVLIGDDARWVEDLDQERLVIHLAADGAEVRPESAALSFEEVTGRTHSLVDLLAAK